MQNTSKKRHSSQPLGAEAKDARSENEERRNTQPLSGETNDPWSETEINQRETNEGDQSTWSQVTAGGRGRGRGGGLPTFNRFGLLSQANSYPDRTMRSASISSRAGSSRSTRGRGTSHPSTQPNYQQYDRSDRPSDLGENTRFTTPRLEGALRDEIVVECQTLNGRPFKGTITFNEAVDAIFIGIMGFQFTDLYSVRMRYSGCPIIKLKLKNPTNIDDLRGVEYFNLERGPDLISCKVLGIRGMQSVPHYDGTENDIRWVKIEGTEYLLTEEEIRQGLEPFGELLTPIREDICEDSDSERDRVGNGTYSVKMKLTVPIPQFLPMHGRRIRVYHSGITKLCTNCYGRHTRRQCRNAKRQWIEYVRDFMIDNDTLGEDYYGKWWEIVDQEYPEYFEQQDNYSQAAVQEASYVQSSSAPSRGAPPPLSRDPRINRHLPQQPHQQQHQQNNPLNVESNYPPLPQRENTDRQHEMSKLLASGLTLTDARKYLSNKAEQQEIERRMLNPTQSTSGTKSRIQQDNPSINPSRDPGQRLPSRGRGNQRHY